MYVHMYVCMYICMCVYWCACVCVGMYVGMCVIVCKGVLKFICPKWCVYMCVCVWPFLICCWVCHDFSCFLFGSPRPFSTKYLEELDLDEAGPNKGCPSHEASVTDLNHLAVIQPGEVRNTLIKKHESRLNSEKWFLKNLIRNNAFWLWF